MKTSLVANKLHTPTFTNFKMKLLTLLMIFLSSWGWGQSAANYAFTTNTTGSLVLDANGNTVDMSSGTTTVAGASIDNAGPYSANIGFNFIFMGISYDQINTSGNGVFRLSNISNPVTIGTSVYASGTTASQALIAPFARDLSTSSTGSILAKTVGTAPNRCFVLQYTNMLIDWNSTTPNGTYQARLYESTGVIEFVYGSMSVGSGGGTTGYSLGFSSSTTSNTFVSITTSSNTVSTSTVSTNTYTAGAIIPNLNSSSDGSRRIYKFTPPTSPVAPSNFSFTSITATTTTLNWTDNSSNETGNIIYRSTDGVNYTIVNTTAANATSYTATGLIPSTTYYWRVASVNEGSISSNLDGSQTTANAAVYYYVGINGGQFSTLTNWNTLADGSGSTPPALNSTDVYIVDGAGTTAGAATIIYMPTTSIGQLKITSNTTLQIASTTTSSTVTITGGTGDDLVVENGSTLNFSSTSNLILMVFSGNNNTGDISGNLIFATGNSLTTTGGTNTIVTVKNTGVVTIGGTNVALVGSTTSLVFASGSNCNVTGTTTGAYPIPLATWSATSSLTLSGSSTSTTTAANNVQSFGNFIVNLTSLTGTLSFWTTSTTALIQGDLTISSTNTGIFRALTSGTLTINGNLNINSGKFQPTSSTGTLITLGNTVIGSSGTLDLSAASASGSFSQRGSNFTNNGTISGGGTLSFFSPTNQALFLAGSGSITANFSTLSIQSTGGLTISHSNQVPTLRVNLFQGTITGSNKITIGTGLALACLTQIGAAGLTSPGGNFDVAPTFNLGTGTYGLIYAQESVSRTTGFEIPSSRAVSNITNSNSNGIVLAGGNLSSAALTFSSGCGNITTSSSNMLTITGSTTSSITRSSSTAFVNGPLAITLPANLVSGSTYFIPVGKSAINAIELVNPTTTSGGTVIIQAEVFDASTGGTAGNLIGSIALNRYWAASITSGSSNFTNSFIRLNDVTSGFDAIASASTLTGVYNLQGGINATITATTISNSSPALTSLPGFFVLGIKSAPTLSNLAINPTGNQCSNVTRSITVTATPVGGAVSAVALNYSINGVAQTAIAMTNTSGNNWSGTLPTVTPSNANVTWSVTATDANSLTKSSTGIAYTDAPNIGITATASASINPVCVNTSTNINLNVNGSGTITIGSGTLLTPGSSGGSDDVTAFNNYRSSYKMQTIYTAAELLSAGLKAGNITSISYNISSNGSSTSNASFVVKIGATSLSVLTDFVSSTGFTTVLPSTTYTHAIGWNSINFTTPYIWDGVSNIVIELSHSGANSSYSAETYYTSTTGNMVATSYNGATTGTLSTKRLNIKINGQVSQNVLSYSWSDGSTVVGTINPLVATPITSTTYTGTATVNGCPISASTIVSVNPCLVTWTGTTSTDWSTASNWSPASVPTSSDNIIIPATGITNYPVASSLTIASGKTTTINSNAQLTVNGTLTNNGTLTLESGATLVQGTGNTVAGSGTFNVKQALTGAGGATPSGRFWYLGSPVSGATSTVFNAAGDNRLWTFAEATQSYTEITTNGVSMSPMQGHVARLGANETSIFTGGLLNTGNYTYSSLTNTGTGSTRGYTLLSNPYPSYLDWTAAYTAAVATNVNLSSSIWYRSNDGTNMVYDIYNATGAIATNNSGGTTTQYIPPMQAFWVYNPNDGTTGSVTFSNSMRSHQNNGGLKSITDFPAFVRLNLENDGAIDQTVLYFDNNAATGYDNFDSDKMMVSNAAQVYSFVDNKKLAINGMKSVKTNKQVPLTVEFPTTKSYSFNATEVAMTDGIVLLEDRLMNVFQDLTMNPVYAFDAVAGTDANRFVVHFQANSGVAGIETAEENGIDIVSNASGLVTITLSEELPAMGTIQIIDINGKVIATQAINEQTTTMNINATTGVYHVLVDSSAKVARKKIVITK